MQKWGHDLASTHDAHHRAMLALKRLEEVQGLFSRTSSPKEVRSRLLLLICTAWPQMHRLYRTREKCIEVSEA